MVLVAGHNKKLEESIISETSGNLKRLLVALLQANRPEGNTIDRRKARNDAKALFEAGEKKFGTDESRFNVILCSRYIHFCNICRLLFLHIFSRPRRRRRRLEASTTDAEITPRLTRRRVAFFPTAAAVFEGDCDAGNLKNILVGLFNMII